MSDHDLAIPLLILAGGKGTRLQALDPTRPKPMVLVHGQPFLHWLVAQYVAAGHREIVFSTGHLAHVVESYPWAGHFPKTRFAFERENEPLGTGGAIKAIFEKRGLSEAWVINGDTLLPQPLPPTNPGLEAMYVVIDSEQLFDATPNIHVAGELVTGEGPGGQYFHAGPIHVTKKALARYTGPAACSAPELLAPATKAGKVGWMLVPGTCYDIGTPDRFKRFETYLVNRT